MSTRAKAAVFVPSTTISGDVLVAVRDLLAGIAEVREGKMFGYPAFYARRKMFAASTAKESGAESEGRRARLITK